MPKRLPRSRTLKGDPKLVYYDSGGGMAGEAAVVLAHGVTFRSEDWENIFPRLATRYRVVAYDARGHGKSGRAASYGVEDLAGDMVHVLRDLVGGPAILMGHSLGGATALAAAAREPDLVRGVVLEDPLLSQYGTGWRAPYYRALRSALAEAADPRLFARKLEDIALPEPGPRGERRLGEVRGFYSVERMTTYFRPLDPAVLDAFVAPGDEPGRVAIRDAASTARCPLLILAAGTSSALAEGEADAIAAKLPDAKVVRFPGVGHRIHGLRPEPFLEAIEPFLRRARATPI